MTLQGKLFRHLDKDSSLPVSTIKTVWIEDMRDLVDTILKVIRHAKINKRNNKNTAKNVNALTVRVQQVL